MAKFFEPGVWSSEGLDPTLEQLSREWAILHPWLTKAGHLGMAMLQAAGAAYCPAGYLAAQSPESGQR